MYRYIDRWPLFATHLSEIQQRKRYIYKLFHKSEFSQKSLEDCFRWQYEPTYQNEIVCRSNLLVWRKTMRISELIGRIIKKVFILRKMKFILKIKFCNPIGWHSFLTSRFFDSHSKGYYYFFESWFSFTIFSWVLVFIWAENIYNRNIKYIDCYCKKSYLLEEVIHEFRVDVT